MCAIGALANRPRLVGPFLLDSSFVHEKFQRACVDDGRPARYSPQITGPGLRGLMVCGATLLADEAPTSDLLPPIWDARRCRTVGGQPGCRVYRVRACSGPGPIRDWALRIYPAGRQDATAILDELAWLNGASRQGLHVPCPQADLQGRLLQVWQSQPGGAPQHAVLLSWLHGRMHERDLTPARLHRVGVLTSQLHRVSSQLATADVFKARRIAWTTDLTSWISGTRARSEQLDPNFQAVLKGAAARLQAQMKTFTQDASTWGWVHSDLHLWNVIFIRDVAGAIDFSDCGWGHHALDLAAYLQYIRHPLAGNFDHCAKYERLRDSLLDGYASVYPLPAAMLDQLPVYLLARLFVTLDWMLDDWPSLDHRAWGPGFMVGAQAALDDYLRS